MIPIIHVASRRFRVLFKLREPFAFRKIPRTGGVTRTIPGEDALQG